MKSLQRFLPLNMYPKSSHFIYFMLNNHGQLLCLEKMDMVSVERVKASK